MPMYSQYMVHPANAQTLSAEYVLSLHIGADCGPLMHRLHDLDLLLQLIPDTARRACSY